MRLPLVVHAPARRLLLAFIAAGGLADSAVGQAPPSLSDTISLTSGDVWSEKSTPSVLGTPAGDPVLDRSTLVPIAEESSTILEGVGDATCNSCNGGGGGVGGFYNRCGCDAPLFPYLTGPGNCDNWCVGPHWNVEVDGMALRRTGVDWSGIEAIANGDGFATDLLDNFGYGPGARIFATGYNDSDFGLQIGYEGINDYHASALFSTAEDVRAFDYQTTFNSLEINVLRRTTAPTKLFAGFRYIQVDEDFTDSLTDGKIVPPPTTPADVNTFVDTKDIFKLENRMIGFQVGALRDAWALNKWLTIEPFGNGGIYYNNFKREEINDTVTTIITGVDTGPPVVDGTTNVSYTQFGQTRNFSDLAFVGEVGITGVVRLNQCVAIRGGYQALVMDGIGEGIDAFFEPGLNGSTILYHGARFGVEYQR